MEMVNALLEMANGVLAKNGENPVFKGSVLVLASRTEPRCHLTSVVRELHK